jgi:hypothetical protein
LFSIVSQFIREDTQNFTKDKYFNGHHHNRTVEENWKMIKNFIMETTEKNIPSKTSNGKQSLPLLHQI